MPSHNSAALRIERAQDLPGPLPEERIDIVMSGRFGRLPHAVRQSLVADCLAMSIDDLIRSTDALIGASAPRMPA